VHNHPVNLLRATTVVAAGPIPFDIVVLAHDERHLRRKVLTLQHGDEVLVDLAEPTRLSHGDRLVLEDGRHAEVIAAEEPLLEITARDAHALTVLAWHLGNRHLPAQIEASRILIARDHVIRDMLVGLGATVREVSEPFEPERGAYHSHATTHVHSDAHGAHVQTHHVHSDVQEGGGRVNVRSSSSSRVSLRSRRDKDDG
jgi:urease accessory protein